MRHQLSAMSHVLEHPLKYPIPVSWQETFRPIGSKNAICDPWPWGVG